ncbi:uncharacterized protein PRCAT00001493001 [Priceomyces carsonii]|uniref:uncharacterized protein n=1 Tax=Priceomyces carsonii TaxID=28549 RepID=UPI002EDA1F5F|nr:unnamed protein product [Priceomyces carsonii]
MIYGALVLQILFCAFTLLGLLIDTEDVESVCSAAKEVVDGEFNYYEGTKYGGTVGMFTAPYYWWNAGEAFGGLIDYYTFCDSSNDTLKNLIYNGMYHQAGSDYDYIPANQSMTEGNDDQGVWGMALMQAVERNFTDPSHSWLSMAQAVYNTMNARWDDDHCLGGLRWQIFTWNSGYNYKNTIANGCLLHIAARLARYTGNDTYAETAEKVWNWLEGVGLLNYSNNEIALYDGVEISGNCTDMTKKRWSYIYGIMMSGAAYLYNHSNDDVWLTRTEEIIEASSYFFNNSIMTESTCASTTCNNDQRTFRSLFARCLGLTQMLAPSTADDIQNWLDTSASAAAQSCSGGTDGITCGENWSVSGWDGVYGLGEQMSALEVILASIVRQFPAPYNSSNGGSSISNVNAGTDSDDTENANELKITTRDKAGAGALTAIVLLIISGGSIWMLF